MNPAVPFRFSGNELAGIMYGLVTAMAVVAAVAEGGVSVLYMAGLVLGVPLALALTHVYAFWVAHTNGQPGHTGARVLWREQLPTLYGPLVMAGVMLGLSIAGVSGVVAAEVTMWAAVAALFVVGFRVARLTGRSVPTALAFGTIDAVIGAVIVLIKVLAH